MKKILYFICSVILISAFAGEGFATKGIPAGEDEIRALKEALRGGIIQIGKTRLEEVREVYGEANDIVDSETVVTYNYGDVRIEFIKRKKWKYWEYDSFKDAVYTDDVDDLRFDLEADEIVGKNISLRYVKRNYGEPTESFETDEDGDMSIFYYGDIKLVFENMYVVRSWRGSVGNDDGGGGGSSSGVLGSTSQTQTGQ